MQKQRLIYRVILKLMTFIAAVVLLVVFINSLFPGSHDENVDDKKEPVIINLSGMDFGEIRYARWNGREVAILKRAVDHSIQKTDEPQQLNPQSRSIFPDYFVFFNTGDSANCPLFFNGKTLKDTCSGKHFDLAGREKSTRAGGFMIEVPPHFFVRQSGKIRQLHIGKWKRETK